MKAPGLVGSCCKRPSRNKYRFAAASLASITSSDKPRASHNSNVSGLLSRTPLGPHSTRKSPNAVFTHSERMFPPTTDEASSNLRFSSIPWSAAGGTPRDRAESKVA